MKGGGQGFLFRRLADAERCGERLRGRAGDGVWNRMERDSVESAEKFLAEPGEKGKIARRNSYEQPMAPSEIVKKVGLL